MHRVDRYDVEILISGRPQSFHYPYNWLWTSLIVIEQECVGKIVARNPHRRKWFQLMRISWYIVNLFDYTTSFTIALYATYDLPSSLIILSQNECIQFFSFISCVDCPLIVWLCIADYRLTHGKCVLLLSPNVVWTCCLLLQPSFLPRCLNYKIGAKRKRKYVFLLECSCHSDMLFILLRDDLFIFVE